IRILQVLWGPNAEAAPDNIKCHDVSNVHGGQAQADDASAEKLAGAKTGESEGTAQAKVVGLARSIERFTRRHRDHHQQREREAFHEGLDDYRRDETGIRIIRVVASSNERPFVQLHREVESGDEQANTNCPFPANQSAAA